MRPSYLAFMPRPCDPPTLVRNTCEAEAPHLMLLILVVVLVVLWSVRYLDIPNLALPDMPLFSLSGHVVTLVEAVIFLVVVAALGVLPTPLRQIGFAVVLVWLLATFGLVAIAGLASLMVLAMIVALLAAFFGGLASRGPQI
jgi:hypothetical protein